MAISNLLQAFSDQKWLLPYSHFKKMSDILMYKFTTGNIEKFLEIKEINRHDPEEDERRRRNSGARMVGDTMLFPIEGTLMPEVGMMEAMCGFVSTISLGESLKASVIQHRPHNIIFPIRSPGGAVTGVPELGDLIAEVANDIPSIAFTDTMMASGGFWLGSAVGRIAATRSAILGSVGVFQEVHKIQEDGVEVHVFQAGSKKTFGHPNVPMTDAESVHFQKSVDQTMELFLKSVSDFRSIDIEELRKTEGSHGEAEFNSIFVDDIVNSIDDLF